MSLWLPIAILGHLLNAAAFIVDKALLTTAFKKSGTYASLIGGLSCIALFAIPWTKIPTPSAWLPILGFGAFFVLAVWMFFEALSRAEATRVVPIIGSLIPVFTLIDTSILIGERLTSSGYIGFAFLVVATAVLAYGKGDDTLDWKTVGICLLSAILFAASSALGKVSFELAGFLDVFAWSRIAAFVVVCLIFFLAPGVRAELFLLATPRSKRRANFETNAFSYMVFGQVCGALGFLLVQLAIAQGSAAIVNALQAVQYAVLVLAAWFGGSYLARILQERRTRETVIIKSVAIALVGIGLYLVSQ